MKKSLRIALIFLVLALFALTVFGSVYSSSVEASITSNPATFDNSDIAIVLVDSESYSTYVENFTILGNTYTAVIVTNSELTNVTRTTNGIGIQFQATAPEGTMGFCNLTIPRILVGSDIDVFQNGVKLEENAAYTQERKGEEYLFHLTFGSGTHEFIVEAAMSPISSQTPSSQSLFGMPIETVITIAVAGTAAAAGIGGAIYGIKHVMISKAAGAAGGGGGSGGGNTPPPMGSGSASVPTGTNVAVQPHPNVQMQFTQVNSAGIATANPLATYPRPPNGIPFLGTVFDIKTTAVFSGFVLVGLLFDGTKLKDEEKKKIRVYRNDPQKGDVWEDVTSSIDIKKNIAYGKTDHFSIFGVR